MGDADAMTHPRLTVHLDDLLDVAAMAAWRGCSLRTVREKSNGRNPIWPAFGTGKCRRWHVRTVLATEMKIAGKDAGFISTALNTP